MMRNRLGLLLLVAALVAAGVGCSSSGDDDDDGGKGGGSAGTPTAGTTAGSQNITIRGNMLTPLGLGAIVVRASASGKRASAGRRIRGSCRSLSTSVLQGGRCFTQPCPAPRPTMRNGCGVKSMW